MSEEEILSEDVRKKSLKECPDSHAGLKASRCSGHDLCHHSYDTHTEIESHTAEIKMYNILYLDG